jgi:hypothetical protein
MATTDRTPLLETGLLEVDASYVVSAGIWFGTTEQAAKARALPFVRVIDYWYPFERDGWFNWRRRYEDETRLRITLALPDLPSVDPAVAGIARYCDVLRQDTVGHFLIVDAIIRQADVGRVLNDPFVLSMEDRGPSLPDLVAVKPRSALPSDHVVISGDYFDPCQPFPGSCPPAPTVTFGGILSPRVAVLDRFRLDAEVPAGLDPGPVDVIVRLRSGESQVFPRGKPWSLSVGARGRGTFARDDTAEVEYVAGRVGEEPFISRLRWSDPRGVPRELLDLPVRTVAFDGEGRLLVSTIDGSYWYDVALRQMSAGPREAANATALLFDHAGNLVVVNTSSVIRLSPAGVVLGRIDDGGAWAADLDVDQCTLYRSGAPVGRLDVCTMTRLPSLPNTNLDVLCVLPDGTLLGLQNGTLWRYRSDGVLISSHRVAIAAAGLAVSADARWVRIGGSIARYDLTTDEVTVTNGSLPPLYGSLATYGGWTAARGFAHYADGEIDELPQRRRVMSSTPVSTPALTLATPPPVHPATGH